MSLLISPLPTAMHVAYKPLNSRLLNNSLFSSFSSAAATSTTTNPISHHYALLDSSRTATALRQIHARLLRTGLYGHVILTSKLVAMYSKLGRILPDANSVFRHMPHRNIYSWNIMIGEFARSGFAARAVGLFTEMRHAGVDIDVFTVPIVLRAYASLGEAGRGGLLHGYCLKLNLEGNVFVGSALVGLYVSLGRVAHARKVFDGMSERDFVLWTSMVGGYAQNGEPLMALELFNEMVGKGVELDGVVMVSLLLALAQLGWLRHGKCVHAWTVRRCLGLGLSVGNALIDMYVKCGLLDWGHRMFDRMRERDVISWSSLILGYGLNGHVEDCFSLFELMRRAGVEPNSVTFLGVLSACSHAGMVDKAWQFFEMMRDYKVEVDLKHYACVVDVFSRAGLLVEAERFVIEMPMKADAAIWGALLGGCRVHSNVAVAERAVKRLLELEPNRSGYYVLMANIYAAAGRFEDAERIWRAMRDTKVDKVPGHSHIESDSSKFLSRKNGLVLALEGGLNGRQ